jgi:hypothetical protein
MTTLRNVLGTKNLSELLSDRENISHFMQVFAYKSVDQQVYSVIWYYRLSIIIILIIDYMIIDYVGEISDCAKFG